MSGRHCEHCGSDPWLSRNFARMRDEMTFWRDKAKTLASQLEAMKLEREFGAFKDRTDVAWLQGKVVAQAREIKRLNDAQNVQRIREGQEPRPDKAMTSATVAESKAQ